jgi:anthranilate synthase component 2
MKMKILVFDNYDSFTYNLVHLIEKILHVKVDVFRNDQIALENIHIYDKIILSPGPGVPKEAGLLLPLIKEYASKKSILGVCLGHQAIGEAFGGTLINLTEVFHGVATPIHLTSQEIPNDTASLFYQFPETFEVGRYQSWVVSDKDLPDCLEVTAIDQHGYIMAMQHKEYDITGVQFHPESVLTPSGEQLMRNWLKV